MDLRFKHFTTYMVTIAVVGAAAFQFKSLAAVRPYACVFGALVSLIYWRIDTRTAAYLKAATDRVARYSNALGIDVLLPNPTRLGSGAMTRVLFALFTAGFVALAIRAF